MQADESGYIRSPAMEEENELIALRRQKLEALRGRGVPPFGQSFETSGTLGEVREKFVEGDSFGGIAQCSFVE